MEFMGEIMLEGPVGLWPERSAAALCREPMLKKKCLQCDLYKRVKLKYLDFF